ncbi:4-hydroxythreonine-4-phosphate dehydrogenase PdxA [Qipengyuania thermophila]|uniref:4-hydroxythreonine-4-phosphate dehydrogenase PdxA n=1 Tax=Qipengyuania thermophila TaxID=2509361 RepID=UPI001F3D1A97|nr:4-hydroxythreonine-4-phosphate dehydrogenase PdxA [Qipengyuania thermophila]
MAVSLGDPAGIGPELIVRCWEQRRERRLPSFVVVGGAGILAAAARSLGSAAPVRVVDSAEEARAAIADGIPVLPLGTGDPGTKPGRPDAAGARLALASLESAARLALAGRVDGLVTAPVSKAGLAAVGFVHPGQTEFLASACGVEPARAVMMLAGPNLRTVPVTVHIALSSVPAHLSAARIETCARIVAHGLRHDFGIAAPRLAVAALNPHAGEDGTFGSEERDIIRPAIARLRDSGMDVTGPHPADALFTPRARRGYDAAVCMYHDQALIPLKALDFDEGVNVTLGLPIVRTSPDHGTAFDIAGRGMADPGAMAAALRMAADCAGRRRQHG